MADIFRRTLKNRMEEADKAVQDVPPQKDLPVKEKAPSTMSQADFLYGRKKDDEKKGKK